ncbi:hypothetical protein XvhCFBP2543_14060 [Xanthomonas vasicola]|uniref:Transposase family protein n=1 Tax=Xanthomonas vasicola TaxID=56459 RepID=A0ABD7S9A2_XANVA|nr:transposase [Xanthomonas vasicola]PPV01950.1 hypothetical protein XvhCFBP2543_14060 [Xanthomonas vasicola]TWQ29580.1 transposase family protein [Xanthomonas vasicola]TWQ52393.1 transposase family protein [Xanthomonas vasicola]TWQ57845.1 transposase family protein [Xanthomonas vasicola]
MVVASACCRYGATLRMSAWTSSWINPYALTMSPQPWHAWFFNEASPKQSGWDNGSEFAGKVMDRWVYENGVELDFSPRGTPTDNAVVESFNGRLRHECLNAHWFLSLADARNKIEAWRKFYNEQRPHRALAWKTPAEFAREHGPQANLQAPKKVEISTC